MGRIARESLWGEVRCPLRSGYAVGGPLPDTTTVSDAECVECEHHRDDDEWNVNCAMSGPQFPERHDV